MSTMTDKSENLAYDYALSLAGTLEEIWEAVDNGKEYNGQDALEYLDEMPLEIVWEMGEPFSVLMTFGGPNAWIMGGGRRDGGYRLEVFWDHESVQRSEAITRTGEYFRSMVEEV